MLYWGVHILVSGHKVMTFRRTAVILKCSVNGSMHFYKHPSFFIRTAYIFQFCVNKASHYSAYICSPRQVTGRKDICCIYSRTRTFCYFILYSDSFVQWRRCKKCLRMHILSVDISRVSLFCCLPFFTCSRDSIHLVTFCELCFSWFFWTGCRDKGPVLEQVSFGVSRFRTLCG